MATTSSPTWRPAELPRLTVGSPLTPLILSRAMSAWRSAPISEAEWVPCPLILTLIVEAPSTTWALVRTSPSEVRIMPVPAPLSAKKVPNRDAWVRMKTTAGSTLASTACTPVGFVSCELDAGTVTVRVVPEPPRRAPITPPTTEPPTSVAPATVATSRRDDGPRRRGGGGGAADSASGSSSRGRAGGRSFQSNSVLVLMIAVDQASLSGACDGAGECL